MNDADASHVDPAWRARMMAEVGCGDRARATDALLSLTNHEPDRRWIEDTLSDVIDGDLDLQVRQLAVICLGHVTRIHREISSHVVSLLQSCRSDPDLAARAENALDDIEIFVVGRAAGPTAGGGVQ
jgi:hypothetical protein